MLKLRGSWRASTPRITRLRFARSPLRAGRCSSVGRCSSPTPDRRAPPFPPASVCRSRGSLRRRLFALRPEVAARVHHDPARAADPVGWVRRQSGGVRTRPSSTATTSGRSGSGSTTACALATAAFRCARANCSKRCRIRASKSKEAEDITIGRAYRPLLEREYGIRYADEALADRSHSKPRIRPACRSGFTGSTTSAASCPG